jgi:glutamate-1-semialdehyde 2,1-aminomutase
MDRERIRTLTERESELFAERTVGSRALFSRAERSVAGGVTSSFHGRDPWPV